MRLSILILTIIAFAVVANAQDFVKVDGVARLSGTNASVFEVGFFQDGWMFDLAGAGYTPSQTAFMRDNPADGKPLGAGNVTPLRRGGAYK